jgi:DUF3095 family protein
MSRGFFAELKPLPDFDHMFEPGHYHDLPADWTLILTDVEGSTRAIEAGQYKSVNLIGASCIIAVQNALPDLDFPYIFGGDGATLTVPNSDATTAAKALSHIRAVSRQDFGLGLRIAVIRASEILDTGARLKVAKLRISDIQHLAQLAGDGWSKGEAWMKEREHEFGLPEDHEADGDMSGLECRWSPLPARKKEILALIIQARRRGEAATRIYREILGEALTPDLKPISLTELRLGWPPPFLQHEAKMRAKGALGRLTYLIKTYIVSLAHTLILVARGRRNITDPIPYLRELTENTDYLKFDEALRMIVDVSEEQKERILKKLDAHYRDGEIYFGHHSDPCALLTCYIRGPRRHIHFIDAGGGGYAMAAKQLKAQKRLQ